MSAVLPITQQRQPGGNWVAVVPSPSGTVLAAGSTGHITDAAGNVWTLPATGIVSVNGVPDLSTWMVTDLAYVDGVIWQSNGTSWYSKAVPTWSAPTTVSPVAAITATLSWTAPTKNVDGTPITNLADYVLSYGLSQTALTHQITLAATALSYTVTGLTAGTWYFSIKAVNSFQGASAASPILSKTIA